MGMRLPKGYTEEAMAKLTELLRLAGASGPESRARSQLQEGIPQLARFVFLREAWSAVESSPHWIGRTLAFLKRRGAGDGPGDGLAPALARVIAAGASPEDIHEIVRVKQWEMLDAMCNLLDRTGVVAEPELQHLNWALLLLDDEGEPIANFGSLHESVLETDPEGREMRPAPVDD